MSLSAMSVPGSIPGIRPSALISPDEALVHFQLTRIQLADLVRDGRVRPLRNPGGLLCFASDDLAALPREVEMSDALAELTSSKETTVDLISTVSAPAETGGDLVQEVRRLINDVRSSLACAPKWVDIEGAISRFGVPCKTIKQWASAGFIRKSKLGPTFQSKTLYNAEDLDSVLNRIAAGKAPVVALRDVN